ncbi:MAG: carboxypeptidase-like regulatory domain-containing protein [Planctomycetales bacterium]|nr:carboxypeptidase-like regulatory domain-containing protein [Planctomycetales bacterium]
MQVRAPGLPGLTRSVPPGEDGSGATWDLPRPAKVSGVVRDPSGMPAAGVRVLAKPADGAADLGQAETGADGTYELGGLEEGRRYDVRTWSPLHAPGGPIAVTPPAVGVDFNLDPGGTLVIEVLTADGKPVPQMPQAPPGMAAPIHSFATLSGDQGYGTTTTNWTTQEGGKLVFRALPAGRYAVRAQVRGHGDARLGGISVPRSGEIKVPLLLGRGGFATIEVRGKEGTMLGGATVFPEKEADTPFGLLVSGTTGADGRASVGPLPAGLQALLVRADGHEPARLTVQISDGITVPAPEVRLAGKP